MYRYSITLASWNIEAPPFYVQNENSVLSLTDVIYKLKGKVPFDFNQ
jgi:hypothetical protein